MNRTPRRQRFLKWSGVLGGLIASAAVAQTGDQAAVGADADVSEVTVTGSRIRQRNLESVSPILEVGPQDFEERGAVRIEQVLNRMPQITTAANGNTGGRPPGTSQVDLRGLGPDRTLVLVNGKRLPYGSPRHLAADINQIPLVLIENVEVLTGGASAVYGSDALAGVVNFKLKQDFQGLKVRANASIFQHENDNDFVRSGIAPWEVANPGEYVMPEKTVWDGLTREVSFAAGVNLNEGRGNATVYGTWRKIHEVKMAERDYTVCQLGPLTPGGTSYTCRPSPVDDPASFVNTGAPGLPPEWRVFNGEFVARNPLVDQFNEQPYAQHMRPDEQYSFGGLAHYRINDHLEPYFEATFSSVNTFGDFSPTGVLNNGIVPGVGGFNCDNPFFSAQQANYLCTSRGLSTAGNYDPVTGAYLGPEDIATGVVINRRTTENGNRHDELNLTSYRVALGFRGNVVGPFDYDVAGIFADVALDRQHAGVSLVRTAQALNAVIDRRVNPDGSPLNPATFGQPVCAINADATPINDVARCAPIDYFSTNGPSAASVAYIDSQGLTYGHASLSNIVAAVNGNLGEYGVKLPWAENGVGVAFGAEYRKNNLRTNVDVETQAQQIDTSVVGSTTVQEFFGEISVPLAQNQPFMRELSIEGAYRSSEYKDSVTTDTYKLGIHWAPLSEVRFRGTYQRAVRAPNVLELYAGQSRSVRLQLAQNGNGSFDPCAGAVPFATFEQCARTGVQLADYGSVVDNPFVGQLVGGNPNLGPETGDTYTFGVVFEPSFAPGLTASVDHFDIQVDNLVGTINANITLRECMNTGNPFFCDLIRRGAGGTLFATEDSYISILNVNTGSLTVSGIDLSVDYRRALPSMFGREWGRINAGLVGTYLEEYTTKPLPTSTPAQTFNCAGYHGFACVHPKPRWRHNLQIGWETPWDGVWLGTTWRYFSSVDISRRSSQPALAGAFFPVQDLKHAHFIDVSGAWSPTSYLTLRAGVNNLFDKYPPLTTETNANFGGLGNTYGGFYDNLGRQIFFNVTMDF